MWKFNYNNLPLKYILHVYYSLKISCKSEFDELLFCMSLLLKRLYTLVGNMSVYSVRRDFFGGFWDIY